MGRQVTEREEGVTYALARQAVAMVGVAALALLLMALPVLALLGVVPGRGLAVLGSLAAGLVAVAGGVKLAAVLWGLKARFLASEGLLGVEASID